MLIAENPPKPKEDAPQEEDFADDYDLLLSQPTLPRRESYFKLTRTDRVARVETPAIYKYLSHHYVLRKSVVFIVD